MGSPIFEKLSSHSFWEEWIAEKKRRGLLTRSEEKEFKNFLESTDISGIGDHLRREDTFLLPSKKLISKNGTGRKRAVYSFTRNEMWMLKGLSYLLKSYDGIFAPCLYSFRTGKKAGDAVRFIKKLPGIEEKRILKADVSDYFNSIDEEMLLRDLEKVINNGELMEFFEKLLLSGKCLFNGEVINEKRGAMAGLPVASFFANIYLAELDRFFVDKKIPTVRYSDDILLVFSDEEELAEGERELTRILSERKLKVNPEKMKRTAPGEEFSFLGVSFNGRVTGIASNSVSKMQGKMRRKARALYRWRVKKGKSFEEAAGAFIRIFDGKFYDLKGDREYTWSRYFFPLIDSDEGLKRLEEYEVACLRYLSTGRYCKKNYDISYEKLKTLGYTSLVNEFYRWKKEELKCDRMLGETARDRIMTRGNGS